ncbi:hypothetical protein EV421DRAFT_1729455 [Armillaria borealis]|uniref:Uncharacterized protein n=1 Tax=Armillaria borealis TaxID=47425 RepID=A0AA39N3L8_9AGAR|nr:hypothetical protein EV421DRAFT_1729455 [Armillaria borealis]
MTSVKRIKLNQLGKDTGCAVLLPDPMLHLSKPLLLRLFEGLQWLSSLAQQENAGKAIPPSQIPAQYWDLNQESPHYLSRRTNPEFMVHAIHWCYKDKISLKNYANMVSASTCHDKEVKALTALLSTVAAYQLHILEIQIKVNVLILPDYEQHGNMLHRFSHLVFNSADHDGFEWLDIQLGTSFYSPAAFIIITSDSSQRIQTKDKETAMPSMPSPAGDASVTFIEHLPFNGVGSLTHLPAAGIPFSTICQYNTQDLVMVITGYLMIAAEPELTSKTMTIVEAQLMEVLSDQAHIWSRLFLHQAVEASQAARWYAVWYPISNASFINSVLSVIRSSSAIGHPPVPLLIQTLLNTTHITTCLLPAASILAHCLIEWARLHEIGRAGGCTIQKISYETTDNLIPNPSNNPSNPLSSIMALLLVNAPPDHNLEKRIALDYKFCALLEHNMSRDKLAMMDRKAVSNTHLYSLIKQDKNSGKPTRDDKPRQQVNIANISGSSLVPALSDAFQGTDNDTVNTDKDTLWG